MQTCSFQICYLPNCFNLRWYKSLVFIHVARHTFGTYLINKGVSIEAIPKIMGHTNMKQSLLYARMLGVTAINEMKKILDTDQSEEDDC